jgi:iron complex transport system ATP-binding protein
VEEIRVTLLEIQKLVVSRGRHRVLDDITLSVQSRERVAVIGPNGAGKTTLMRAILGLLPADGGNVLLDGVPTLKLTALERAERVAWLPQQALLDEPISALEFIRAARFRFGEGDRAARDAALHALKRVGADEWAQRLITQLSGGEQQRVALAALFAQEANLLLADEPANHLDPAQQASAWRLLTETAASSAIIVITHDINLVPLLGDPSQTRIVALNRGRVAFDILANDPDLPRRLCDLYGIEMQAYAEGPGRVIFPKITSGCPT